MLIGEYNEAVWPASAAGWLVCLFSTVLVLRPRLSLSPMVAGCLAAIWAWSAIVFHQLFFADLFLGAPLFAVSFVIEAGLFLWAGLARSTSFRFQTGLTGGVALGVIFFALVCWPMVDWFASGDWQRMRLAGTTPGPTTVFTMGLLLLAEGRSPLHLAIIPLLWSLVGGMGALGLRGPEVVSLPLAGVGTFALMIWRNRHVERPSAW